MTADTLWLALGMVLVIEGLFPLLAPGAWRKMFAQLLQLDDGKIRSIAIGSILLGLLAIWSLSI